MVMPEDFGDLHPSYGNKNAEVCPACLLKNVTFSLRQAKQLRKTKPTEISSWLPDGRILYSHNELGKYKYVILDPETEEEKPLSLGVAVEDMRHPTYSPDGKRIAFLGTVQSKRGTWVISLTDNSMKLLAGPLIPLQWSLDGKWIFANDDRPDKNLIVSVPADGGDPKTITALPSENISNFNLSHDGRKFVYAAYEYKSDIWLIENFDPARKK